MRAPLSVYFHLGLADGRVVEFDLEALGLRLLPARIEYRTGRGTMLYRRTPGGNARQRVYEPRFAADRRAFPSQPSRRKPPPPWWGF